MKYIRKFGFVLLAAAALAVACDNTDDSSSGKFGPDKEVLSVGPEGSTESVKILANKAWIASTEEPWILITPANGDATRDCQIRIDSTYQNVLREGEVRFTSAGETRTVKISQMGFGKQIIVEGAQNGVYNLEVPDYVPEGKTIFDVRVTTNVDFDVVLEDLTTVPDDAGEGAVSTTDWLNCRQFVVDLVQSKPRTVTLRFDWKYNTKWWNQKVKIKFVPKNGEELIQQDAIIVEQTKAPKITDDRAGDSIAVLSIARQLNVWGMFDSSKNMQDWGENIELYDKSAPREKQGRVKYVNFFMFSTNSGIPFEVRYLNKAEEIVFYANTNHTTKDIDLGTSICELGQYGNLKRLTIAAYGTMSLPDGFEKLGSALEELDLTSERFTKIPSAITPENFPHLKKLRLVAVRSTDIYDLSNSTIQDPGLGAGSTLPRFLLEWESLEELNLSYNYFQGAIDPMNDYPVKWTAEDKYPSLVGKPKVLPNCKVLRLNLNRFSGELPEWLLNHPYVKEWDPYTLIFSQEGVGTNGVKAGFTNIPDKVTPPAKVE